MQLRRATQPPRLISLVSMIDVLLIMLVFFMVTSTYLNLDMIPVVRSEPEDSIAAPDAAMPDATTPVMIRLGADSMPYLRGQPHPYDALTATLTALPADTPILILPSLQADTQALVTLMDVITTAGITQLRILQMAAP